MKLKYQINRTDKADNRSAFTLIEVTLALGVAAFCLLAIFGLLPIGLRSNQQAVQQTAANGIISRVAADLRATPSTVPLGSATTSQIFGIPIPQNPATGATTPITSSTTVYFSASGQAEALYPGNSQPPALYMLTASLMSGVAPALPSGSATARTATMANLLVTWPAASGTANAAGSAQAFVALDRN